MKKKLKLKEESKNNIFLFGIFLMVVIGGLLIAVRNQSFEEIQKKTEMSVTQISQKN